MHRAAARTGVYVGNPLAMAGTEDPLRLEAFDRRGSPVTLDGDRAHVFYELDDLLRLLDTTQTHPLTREPFTIHSIRPILTPTTPYKAYANTLVKLSERGWDHEAEVRADVGKQLSDAGRYDQGRLGPFPRNRPVFREDLEALVHLLRTTYVAPPASDDESESMVSTEPDAAELEEEEAIAAEILEVTWDRYRRINETAPARARRALDIMMYERFDTHRIHSVVFPIGVADLVERRLIRDFLGMREWLCGFAPSPECSVLGREALIEDCIAFVRDAQRESDAPSLTVTRERLRLLLDEYAPHLCPVVHGAPNAAYVMFPLTGENLDVFLMREVLPRMTHDECAHLQRYGCTPEEMVALVRAILARAFPIYPSAYAHATLRDALLRIMRLRGADGRVCMPPEFGPSLPSDGGDQQEAPPMDFYEFETMRRREAGAYYIPPIYMALENLRPRFDFIAALRREHG
jgi:hypothetical protein